MKTNTLTEQQKKQAMAQLYREIDQEGGVLNYYKMIRKFSRMSPNEVLLIAPDLPGWKGKCREEIKAELKKAKLPLNKCLWGKPLIDESFIPGEFIVGLRASLHIPKGQARPKTLADE